MIHIVERELGVFIDEDYPLLKFYNQYDEIVKYRKREKKEYDKIK